MKLFYPFFLLCLFFVFTSCSNDDDTPSNPVDLLPPATQTGENTFGCLLDGKAFLVGGGINPLDCTYQFVDGGYYFYLKGKNSKNGILKTVSIGTESLQIFENESYILKEREEGNAFGRYYIGNLNTGESQNNYTSTVHTGELTITKLDFENNIVSGTFWFDVKDENGKIHEIREGRFDMQFTQ